jgi:phosphoribosylformylglycinamidine synthase
MTLQGRIGIVVFPGSNRERDVAYALEVSGYGGESIFLDPNDEEVPEGVELVVLPGGFSYGDYLRSGVIAKVSPLMGGIRRYAAGGGYVVGICNGFQILLESGLLEGGLVGNVGGRFVCRYVGLKVEGGGFFGDFYGAGERVYWPVAHGEGRFVADEETLEVLESEGRVVLRYDELGGVNGSMNGIAGIVNRGGNVLGVMPHPENAVGKERGYSDGLRFFEFLLSLMKVRI